MILAGLPTDMTYLGMSFVTTEPTPMMGLSQIITSFGIVTLAPISCISSFAKISCWTSDPPTSSELFSANTGYEHKETKHIILAIITYRFSILFKDDL